MLAVNGAIPYKSRQSVNGWVVDDKMLHDKCVKYSSRLYRAWAGKVNKVKTGLVIVCITLSMVIASALIGCVITTCIDLGYKHIHLFMKLHTLLFKSLIISVILAVICCPFTCSVYSFSPKQVKFTPNSIDNRKVHTFPSTVNNSQSDFLESLFDKWSSQAEEHFTHNLPQLSRNQNTQVHHTFNVSNNTKIVRYHSDNDDINHFLDSVVVPLLTGTNVTQFFSSNDIHYIMMNLDHHGTPVFHGDNVDTALTTLTTYKTNGSGDNFFTSLLVTTFNDVLCTINSMGDEISNVSLNGIFGSMKQRVSEVLSHNVATHTLCAIYMRLFVGVLPLLQNGYLQFQNT